MRAQLIKLQDKFILVSNEKLKDKDWFYNTFSDNQPLIQQRKGDWTTCFNQRKIIAGIPSLPEIDFSLLSEEDCLKIGFIDFKKLSYDFDTDINSEARKGFIEGLKTAQSLNDKMFSLDDMINAFNEGWYCKAESKLDGKDKFIQSLQQNVWDVEVEMECPYEGTYDNLCKVQPKITNIF